MTKTSYVINLCIILTIVVLCLTFVSGSRRSNAVNINFLKSYNWETEPQPVEKVEFVIPSVFDDVYNNYNQLQTEAGLDLSPYKGYHAIRYTYIVTNFPLETDMEVRANVICVDDKPVAGDICTVNLDGFMYSLNFNASTCFSAKDMKLT